MIAWPETIFLTDYGFFRPPATLALSLSPLGVSRDFVWNESYKVNFLQPGFEISEDLIYKLILGLDSAPFLLFAFLISALHVYILIG